MVVETSCDLMEDESRTGIDTTRCLNCGNFEDRCIRTNRVISRLPRHVAPQTVGNRSLSAIQTYSLERVTQTDCVIAESPRGRAPRLPVEVLSAKTLLP